jgi:CubicO group peptidase (beta-lactamase class C family)
MQSVKRYTRQWSGLLALLLLIVAVIGLNRGGSALHRAAAFPRTAIRVVSLRGRQPLPVTPMIAARLTSYVQATMKRLAVPGAEVVIVQGGRIVYAHGFGMRHAGSALPITPDTRMMIGSVTKSMTTMMMGTLVDEGRMSWDEPVKRIMPQFVFGDPALTVRITVHDMVCACSGVRRRDLEFIFNAATLTPQDVVRSLAGFKLLTPFGQAFQYSNQMVATGGYVAAMAAGGRFATLYPSYTAAMQARVLTPIGMTRSTFSFDTVLADANFATPHGMRLDGRYIAIPVREEQAVTPVAPAGALWSTATDLARYLITELRHGLAPDGRRVVSAHNLQVTWTPQVKVDAQISYGLGWMVSDYMQAPLVFHDGNTFGFSSDVAFLPNAGLGIVVLTNAQAANLFTAAVRTRVLELVYRQPFAFEATVNSQIAQGAQALAAMKLAPTVDGAAVRPFLGTYANNALGTVRLKVSYGALLLQSHSVATQLRAQLGPNGRVSTYLFYDPPLSGFPLSLSRNAAGQPTLVLGTGPTQYTFVRKRGQRS